MGNAGRGERRSGAILIQAAPKINLGLVRAVFEDI
jgi:hypothetical protein